MKRIYVDNNATTPVAKEVLEAMLPFFSEKFGNASSLHSFGREARIAVENAREKIIKKAKASGYRLVFTSGGTEANNLALKGVAFALRKKGKHIITTKVEHKSIMNACKWLEKNGFEITYLPVDREGFVNPSDVESAVRSDTILVSVIHANNEIGTIEPIKEVGSICREKGIYFHTDACQSFTKVDFNAKRDNVDLATLNAHKIYGPKGVGALLLREDVKIEPLLHGGRQEGLKRAGTENVPAIVGFGKAVNVIKDGHVARMGKLRDRLINKVLKEVEGSHLNGPRKKRLCNNANFYFERVEGESLMLQLDTKGIACSTGSACSSGSLEPSHVLLAIGLKPEEAHGSLRIGLGIENTEDEVEYIVESIRDSVETLRKMYPG